MSSAHAFAVRPSSQPSSDGSPESPYPGTDGSTRWKASSALPPCAVGSVSGPIVSRGSITEPGRPAVGHDQRQRVLVLRAHVDEVDVDAVDLGPELRQRVQPGLDPADVVVRRPVAGERLDRRELDALRAVGDELLARQARGGDA